MTTIQPSLARDGQPIRTAAEFWRWFAGHEKEFFTAISQRQEAPTNFFDQLSPKLDELREGILFQVGMHDDHTAELILTADSNVKNIGYVEELVAAAPALPGWKFTALQQASDVSHVRLEIDGYRFDQDNLFFYANESAEFPDEVDLTIVYTGPLQDDKATVTSGVHLFLENFLGELHYATAIDSLAVANAAEAGQELVPIEKLPAFLTWREKEFVEKYEGLRRDTEHDDYAGYTAELADGRTMVAVMNTSLFDWDAKASHPWILHLEVRYDAESNNGMPSEDEDKRLEALEEWLRQQLRAADGYLSVGRETANGCRELYFACKEFRRPPRVLDELLRSGLAEGFEVTYNLYKDKYWQTFRSYMVA